MQTFLRSRNIRHVRTLPASPQANGKIERWWTKLDERLEDLESWEQVVEAIEEYVNCYNYKIPHMGLEKINGFHAYPIEVYSNQSIEATTLKETNIIIDGKKTVPLSDFLSVS